MRGMVVHMSLHTVYKQIGETPLEALERFRAKEGIDISVPMTYAGRLDPCAEGLLLLLSGSDVHRKEDFLGLPKTYEFEVLFGVSTDSLDALGIPSLDVVANENTASKLLLVLDSFLGTFEWEYPKFSSKTVEGKPLFHHTRLGNDIETPTRPMKIESLDVLGTKIISLSDVEERVLKIIHAVSGDFRQAEIEEGWKQVFTISGNKHVSVMKFKASVGSGTYIRVLAQKMGEAVGLPSLALSIKRTKIGGMSVS